MTTVRRRLRSAAWMTIPAPTSAWTTATSATTTEAPPAPSAEQWTTIPTCPISVRVATTTADPVLSTTTRRPASAMTISGRWRFVTFHSPAPPVAPAAPTYTRTTPEAGPDPTSTRTTPAAAAEAAAVGVTTSRTAATPPTTDATTPTACKCKILYTFGYLCFFFVYNLTRVRVSILHD